MERIVIEVDDVSAKKWRYASLQKKERLAKSIEILIDKTDAEDEDGFWQFVEKISRKASENGLTEEALGRILNES